MWLQDEYEGFDGKFWSLPRARCCPSHGEAGTRPCGTPPATPELRHGGPQGPRRPGVLRGHLTRNGPVLRAYKKEIPTAEPVGSLRQRQHHGHLPAFLHEDPSKARHGGESGLNYVQSNTFRYHDTFPHPEAVPYWPEIMPDYGRFVKSIASSGAMVLGDPDDALRQVQRLGSGRAPTSWSMAWACPGRDPRDD